MKSTDNLISDIITRLKNTGVCTSKRVKFRYLNHTDNKIEVSRERGEDTPIYFRELAKAIEAVRRDHKVYSEGPSRLRKHGLTHITSPLWALLHLLSLKELIT
ncbi:MAG: hypothetical protein IH931_01310 [candidate division Zixibacteria bacterium]|nr:hypothetical protein [candidate division Zixibacteria bacterium]